MNHLQNLTSRTFTLVVPVYNNASNLDSIVSNFEQFVINAGYSATLIFVDDAGNEATRIKAEEASVKNKFVATIRLKRNVGQVAATACGIHCAKGDIIITMDDDLQYPMHEVPNLINHYLKSGKTILFGYPRKRMQGFRHKIIVQIVILLFDYIILPRCRKINFYTSFRIFNRSLFNSPDRHLLYLWEIPASEMDSIPVAHVPRSKGRSSYTFIKKARIFWPAMVFGYVKLSLIMLISIVPAAIIGATFNLVTPSLFYLIAGGSLFLLISLLPARFLLERGKKVNYEIEKTINL